MKNIPTVTLQRLAYANHKGVEKIYLDFNRSGMFHYRLKFVRQKAAVVIKVHLLTKTVHAGEKSNAATSNIY